MKRYLKHLYTDYITRDFIPMPVTFKLRTFYFTSAITKTFIGLWLLNPYWDTFDSTPAYTYIRAQVSESLLGMIIAIIGVLSLYGSYIGSNRVRITSGYLSLLLYLYLALVLGRANFIGLSIPIWGSMAIGEFINCTVFSKKDYDYYDRSKEEDS